MKNARLLRILLLSGIVAGLLFSQVCVIDNLAKPLLDSNISLTKTGDPTTFTQAGEEITYSYVIKNTSEYEIYSISLTDNLIADLSCPKTTLSKGAQMTCTGVYTVTQEDVEKGEVTNQATVKGSYSYYYDDDSCCGCDDGMRYGDASAKASFTATLAEPAIELTKTGSPATFTGPGQQISYEYLVTNTGGTALTGPLGVTDDLVTVSCPSGDLAPGESLTCTGSYTTTEADVAAGSITNHADASMGEAGASASFTVDLEADPALGLTKTPDPTVFSSAGTLVIYDFTVTNTGNVTLDGPFELQDEMLDQQECPEGPLAPGESMSCAGYYLTRESDANQTINNCARVRGYYLGGPVRSPEACTDVYYQAPREKPESEPAPQSACDIDPESEDCYCEQNPGSCS